MRAEEKAVEEKELVCMRSVGETERERENDRGGEREAKRKRGNKVRETTALSILVTKNLFETGPH